MIHAQLCDNTQVLKEQDFASLEEYRQAWETSEGREYWHSEQVRQCEMCDQLFEIGQERFFGGRKGYSEFCSLECKEECDEEIQYWDRVDRDWYFLD